MKEKMFKVGSDGLVLSKPSLEPTPFAVKCLKNYEIYSRSNDFRSTLLPTLIKTKLKTSYVFCVLKELQKNFMWNVKITVMVLSKFPSTMSRVYL